MFSKSLLLPSPLMYRGLNFEHPRQTFTPSHERYPQPSFDFLFCRKFSFITQVGLNLALKPNRLEFGVLLPRPLE